MELVRLHVEKYVVSLPPCYLTNTTKCFGNIDGKNIVCMSHFTTLLLVLFRAQAILLCHTETRSNSPFPQLMDKCNCQLLVFYLKHCNIECNFQCNNFSHNNHTLQHSFSLKTSLTQQRTFVIIRTEIHILWYIVIELQFTS